jgi:hypothetical protein
VDSLPALELLASTHEFPGPYMFKVIGRVEDGFVARVVSTVRRELDADEDPPYKLQQTASGRHVSITLEPIVQSSYQVLAVYQRLRDTAGVVTIL